MKLRALLVICLLMPFAASLANADDHIDNMCFIPQSEGGIAGQCKKDADWTFGWYTYRYGAAWTIANRFWLLSQISPEITTFPVKVADVTHPPRGTASRSNKPLPVTKSSDGITTSFPDGMKVSVKSDSVHIVVLPEDGSTITFDYENGVRTERDSTTGEERTRPLE